MTRGRMDHVFLMLHLAAFCLSVRVVGSYMYAADNGHTGKKSPMDYSRYADDERNIGTHNSDRISHPSNTCDNRFELKNSTIIRTKDSMFSGAQFVDDMKVTMATECRWQCCQQEDKCDTSIFVDDKTKDKNCFLFKCRIENTIKCKFSSHAGYVSAMIGGFLVVPESGMISKEDGAKDDENTEFNDNHKTLVISEDTSMTSTHHGEETAASDDQCRDDQIQCANGECIIARYVCNDVKDCLDGSDEMGCKYDTNTPSSHSSLATNLPKLGPPTAENQGEDKAKATQTMSLEDIRSELASELLEQSNPSLEKDSGDDENNKDVDRKPNYNKSNSNGADENLPDRHDEDETVGQNGEKFDDTDAGAAVETDKADRDRIPAGEVDDSVADSREQQAGAHQDTADERLSGGKSSSISSHHLASGEKQDDLNQQYPDQDNSDGQAEVEDEDRKVQTHEQDERLGDHDQPEISRPSNHRASSEQDPDQRSRYKTNKDNQGYTYDDSEKIPSHGNDLKLQPVQPNNAREGPDYDQQINDNNPVRPDIDQNPRFPDHLDILPDSNSRENLYPYDNYGTNFNGKPYNDPLDYNYHNDMVNDMANPGETYPDRFDNRDPFYQDLQDDKYDPGDDNYINYHRRDRLNNNYNYPVDDPPTDRRLSQRPRPYNRVPVGDDWNQRGDDSGMRDGAGRQRVNGRPYQGRSDTEDTDASQQNRPARPGSWKKWNRFNHPDGTYPDGTYQDGDQDGYDEGPDRDSEAGDNINKADEQDSSEDVDAGQGKTPDDNVVPTVIYNENDDSPAGLSLSSPKPDVMKPHSPPPVSSNEDQDQVPNAGPKVDDGEEEVSTSGSDQLDLLNSRKVVPHRIQPATSAIMPLAVGLIITLFLLLMLTCRLRLHEP